MDAEVTVALLGLAASVVTSIATLAYWLGRRFARLELGLAQLRSETDSKFVQLRSDMELKLTQFKSDMESKFVQLRSEVGQGFREVNSRLAALAEWGNALLDVLASRGYVTHDGVVAMRAVLKLAAEARSRYYTKEDYQRLMALAEKDIEDYTWEDVRELERIADKMEKEAKLWLLEDEEYSRRLFRSAARVRIFAAVMSGLLARREAQPPPEEAGGRGP